MTLTVKFRHCAEHENNINDPGKFRDTTDVLQGLIDRNKFESKKKKKCVKIRLCIPPAMDHHDTERNLKNCTQDPQYVEL